MMFQWFMLVVAVERATEIVVESKVASPIRSFVRRLAYPLQEPPPEGLVWWRVSFMALDALLNCGYCVSVWIGLLAALFAPVVFENAIADLVVKTLFLHGMANLAHVLYELLRRGRVHTFDVDLKMNDNRVEDTQDDQHDRASS